MAADPTLIKQLCPKHAPSGYQRARRPYWCPECFVQEPNDDPRHPMTDTPTDDDEPDDETERNNMSVYKILYHYQANHEETAWVEAENPEDAKAWLSGDTDVDAMTLDVDPIGITDILNIGPFLEVEDVSPKTRTIELPCYGIVLELDEQGSGTLSSDLREEADDTALDEDRAWLALVDTVESMVLAHACAGIDVTTPQYIEGIETAVESGANNL